MASNSASVVDVATLPALFLDLHDIVYTLIQTSRHPYHSPYPNRHIQSIAIDLALMGFVCSMWAWDRGCLWDIVKPATNAIIIVLDNLDAQWIMQLQVTSFRELAITVLIQSLSPPNHKGHIVNVDCLNDLIRAIAGSRDIVWAHISICWALSLDRCPFWSSYSGGNFIYSSSCNSP